MTSKRGMTLVELLVVVAIMVMLVAVGLPMLRPMLEKQSQSQGAQVLRVMLLRARNMAVEKGIPFGLRIERYTNPDGTPTEAAVRLSIVREQPPTDLDDIRVAIDNMGTPTFYEWTGAWTPLTTAPSLQDGTLVQFWGSGEVFAVFVDSAGTDIRFVNREAGVFTTDVTNPSSDLSVVWGYDDTDLPLAGTQLAAYRAIRRGLTTELDSSGNAIFPPHFDLIATGSPYTSSPAPVVIVKHTPSPMAATSMPPMLMPEGVCVDLAFSGTGNAPSEFATGDVTVWFLPNGSLEEVTSNGQQHGAGNKCDGLLHFLVGSWEQVASNIGTLSESTSTNLELPANVWVTVEPRSARVLVNEIKVPTNADPNDDVSEARTFANEIWLEVAAPR